jgi:hypothetical protein
MTCESDCLPSSGLLLVLEDLGETRPGSNESYNERFPSETVTRDFLKNSRKETNSDSHVADPDPGSGAFLTP